MRTPHLRRFRRTLGEIGTPDFAFPRARGHYLSPLRLLRPLVVSTRLEHLDYLEILELLDVLGYLEDSNPYSFPSRVCARVRAHARSLYIGTISEGDSGEWGILFLGWGNIIRGFTNCLLCVII